MLQIISSQDSKIILESQSPQKNIDMITKHIKSGKCQNMTIDITNLNVLDACMVSTLCSAQYYLEYPQGKISWITNSPMVEDYTKSMSLGNTEFSVETNNSKYITGT